MATEIVSRYGNEFSWGTFGVDIFFVISGFIMWITTADRAVGAMEFWYRRIVRIVPLYWGLTIVTASISTNPEFALFQDMDGVRIIKSILFIPHFHREYADAIFPVLVPGWTLNYEIFFYFLFGLSLILARNIRLVMLIALLIALSFIGLFVGPKYPVLITYTNSLLFEFAMGAALGWLYLNRKMSSLKWGSVIVISAIVILTQQLMQVGYRGIDSGVPAAMLVLGALFLENSLRKREIHIMSALGDSSYSLYLSHVMVIAFSTVLWRKVFESSILFDTIFLFTCVVFSCAVGHTIYHLFERPLYLRLRKYPFKRERMS